MKQIPFLLISEIDGSLLEGQMENVAIRISKDGGDFRVATNNAEEFDEGYYCIELTDEELDVEQFAVIKIVCPGAQLVVKQWTPDSGGTADKEAIAEAVWNHKRRTLTSEAHEIIEPNSVLSVTSAVKLTIEPNKP